MSSPLSNLKKGKKVPLGSRPAPYRPSAMSEEELISKLNLERSVDAVKRSTNGEKISDTSLMSSALHRLNVVENKLSEYEKQIFEKDKQIRILEEKCAIYKRAQGYDSEQVEELQKKCHKLQNQVHSMENFLEDYGMIWVGNPNSSDEEDEEDEEELLMSSYNDEEMVNERRIAGGEKGQNKHWNPQSSISTPLKFHMDFDLVLKNIRELNLISGEGEHYIKHTKDGARLQVKEPVSLTLYANGIFMFGGPFRPYEDHQTQMCVQDLMDGYFPGELQSSYPDGVPFDVKDKRDIYFKDKRLDILFPGKGQTLSPEKRDDNEAVYVTSNADDRRTETIDDVVHRQSVEHFLSRLPPAVVKKGKIIDVRDGIKENLSSGAPKNEVILVETDAMKDIKERVNSGSKSRPTTASSVTTLRIKSLRGDKTYMLKMKYTDTVSHVKEQLNKVTGESASYDLKTSFPNAAYTDLDKTLKECGLVPNATLHIVHVVTR